MSEEIKRIAKFEVISDKQRSHYECMEHVSLPTRATEGSCGYDIKAPFKIVLNPGQEMIVPTGLRAKIFPGWFMMVTPKSGLGCNYKVRLNNTVGIIDSDYYKSDNEGHIFVKISNEGLKKLEVEEGKAFCQGIFIPFGITTDDEVSTKRNGGFGSTNA